MNPSVVPRIRAPVTVYDCQRCHIRKEGKKMPKVAIIRCEKNQDECPLTAGFAALKSRTAAFKGYDEDCDLVGVFTCHCPGDSAIDLAGILKNKGVEVLHFCTCTFSAKTDGGWSMEKGGFCEGIDGIIERVHTETGLPCVKGTAHLPREYAIQKWG
jgi:predicted metal-binding protein